MKRILALTLALMLIAGCSSQPEATTAATESTTATTEAKAEIEVNSEGIYEIEGVLFSKLYPMEEASVTKLAEKINAVTSEYLTENNKVFVSLIPDKSYFSDYDEKIDHVKMEEMLKKGIEKGEYISIADTLSLDDFYMTDGHWRQEKIIDTVNKLGETMGFSLEKSDFEENAILDFEYRGMYAPLYEGETDAEVMYYLTNEYTENAVVDNFQKKDFTEVYDMAMLETKTPYDIFLSGPTPFMTIKNPNAENDRKLVIFRDSFASSLVPMIVGEYSEITLIDLRYMASQLMPQFVEFDDQDVLFLYSAAVANNSIMLK